MSDANQDAHWEEKLSDLAWMESILKKRKAELQEVDAVLTERRRQLAEVVQKVLCIFFSLFLFFFANDLYHTRQGTKLGKIHRV